MRLVPRNLLADQWLDHERNEDLADAVRLEIEGQRQSGPLSEQRVGEERRPPPPEWLIERGLDRNNIVAVHTGECWDPGKRVKPATRAQAIDALRHQVPACSKCRPDTALGIEL
ncbi:hypothetical protein GCM10011428_39610 [Streptomyces violaceus]